MKNIVSIFILSFVLFCVCSCEKDEGKLPNIAFKTGANYVSADKIVGLNDTITVGITASKSEEVDVLKTFDVSRIFDGGLSFSILNESLTGAQGDNYDRDVEIITRNQAGTEKYDFTVVNRDGLRNTVSITLTVQ